MFLKNKLKEINKQLEKYQDDLRVYNAEWSYLNDPKRLQQLAAKYLPNMRPTENRQVVNFDTLMRSDFEKELSNSMIQTTDQDIPNRNARKNIGKAFGSFLDKAIKRYEGAAESD